MKGFGKYIWELQSVNGYITTKTPTEVTRD